MADPNAVVKPVGPVSTAIPAAEKPAEAPDQVNDVYKSGTTPAQPAVNGKQKKPKADLNDESSSKKKKKKGHLQAEPVLDGQPTQKTRRAASHFGCGLFLRL